MCRSRSFSCPIGFLGFSPSVFQVFAELLTSGVEKAFELMPRQALHAKSLGFVHPDTGAQMQFEAELPTDFTSLLEHWEKYAKQEA